MKEKIIAGCAATLLFAFHAGAQYEILIPECCTSTGAVFVLDPATGHVERGITSATSLNASVYMAAAAPLKDGAIAALNGFIGSTGVSTTVSVVNPESGALLGSVEVPGQPWTLAVNPQSGVIYAGHVNAGIAQIEEINPATLKMIAQFNVNQGNGIFVSPDGKRIYIPNLLGIDVYSTASLVQIGSVSGPDQVIGFSPDGKTLYAASDQSVVTSNRVYFVNTENLEIAKQLYVGNFGTLGDDIGNPYGVGAVSADGTELYLNFVTALVTLNVNSLSEVSTPVPANDRGQQVLATANGSVYLTSATTAASLALVFDPVSQTFPAQFPLLAGGDLIASANGAQLFLLAPGSTLSVPREAPSTAIAGAGLAGPGAGYQFGVYDPKDNLLLLPDVNGNMEMVDAATLRVRNLLPLGASGPTAYGNSGYMAYFTYTSTLLANVTQFDPVSAKVTGNLTLPVYQGDDSGYFPQLAIEGNSLYVPYSFTFGTCCDLKPAANVFEGTGSAMAVIDTSTFKLSAIYPVSNNLIEGFAVPSGSSAGYLSVTSGVANQLLKMDLSTGKIIVSAPMPAYGTLLVSADAQTLYMYGLSQLYAIDLSTLEVKNTSPLVCYGLAATPDGSYMYCVAANGVNILAASSLDLAGLIPAESVFEIPGPPIVITK